MALRPRTAVKKVKGLLRKKRTANSPSTHSGEYRSVEEQKFILAVPSLMVPYSACVGRRRMTRREFFALGGVGAVAAVLSLAEAISGGTEEPNLLVIITDDQPYYTVSHTKALASLIRDRGTTFSPYAYVSTPICGPARATLLTGKWSHNTGLTKTAGAYQDLHASIYESDTIATRLKQAGYSTYFGGKYINGYDGNAIPSGWDASTRPTRSSTVTAAEPEDTTGWW